MSPGKGKEAFFDSNRWLLICFGLWPPRSATNFQGFLHYIFRKFILISIPYFALTDWLCIKDNLNGDIYDFCIIITVALTHTLSMIKELFVSYNKEFFEQLFKALESKDFRYEACQEKDFFPTSLKNQCRKNAKLMRTIFYAIATAAGIASFLPTVVALIIRAVDSKKNQLPQKLPFYSWVPFSTNTSLTFIIAVIYQVYPALYHAAG